MRAIRIAQALLIASLALSLPAAALTVFAFDADRGRVGDAVAVVFLALIASLLSTPWWPIGAQRGRPPRESLQGMVMIWFGVAFTTHLTWELGWLVLREAILAAPDAIWSYPWWAYIDGGDARYAHENAQLIAIESLTALVGALGFCALGLWRRSRGRSPTATLMLMATAVAHLYGTSLYFASEAIDGFPNVDTSSFVDFALKFWALNGLWLAMPCAVLCWGRQTLLAQLANRGG
ncbi:MAG TPA: emopamil-binding family protein [Myxococcota bacterium]|nr:emopamil-binding family protein [Myxococcota bacterium]